MKRPMDYRMGQRVRDTWYGIGIVTARSPRRLWVRLIATGEVAKYDTAHVIEFIRSGWKRKRRKAK